MLLGKFVFFPFFFSFFLKSIFQFLKTQNFKADDGFGTICKIDAGYYAQGFHFFLKNIFFSFFIFFFFLFQVNFKK